MFSFQFLIRIKFLRALHHRCDAASVWLGVAGWAFEETAEPEDALNED